MNILLLLLAMLFACTPSKQRKEESEVQFVNETEESTLSPDQEAALDALNTLQTGTDEMNQLYSTFPNIDQACYPPDTTFIISQSELLAYLTEFVQKHCQQMDSMIRKELVQSSVLAQEQYNIKYCNMGTILTNYENGIPMKGKWVMHNVLGRRDVVLVW